MKCVFCGKDEESFKGTHLVTNEGNVLYYCSSKCRKNSLKLKRDRRKVRWTEAFHETRNKARDKERIKSEAEKEKLKEEKEKKVEVKTENKSSKKK